MLSCRRKFFLRATKNRLADPSENRALDFKHEFGRSVVCSVSAAIGINRPFSTDSLARLAIPSLGKTPIPSLATASWPGTPGCGGADSVRGDQQSYFSLCPP
jgi:hypothetical protein